MIEITQYKNAKKINEDGDIDCDIKHPTHGWIPFTLNLKDTGSSIDTKKLHDKIIAEKQVQEYQAPSDEEVVTQKSSEVRGQRDALLRADVDPIVCNPLRWADLTTKKQDEWKEYRQKLLDISKQAKFPKVVVYPTKPD
tara:strand:- start:222 stop:638 length:417 start_codon:yes stop_codon:yes gene_type:complete